MYFFFRHVGTYDKNVVQAQAKCAEQGGRLCLLSELWQAWDKGAQWCSWGWVQNDPTAAQERYSWTPDHGYSSIEEAEPEPVTFRPAFPMQKSQSGCGNYKGVYGGTGISAGVNPENKYGANCCMTIRKSPLRYLVGTNLIFVFFVRQQLKSTTT